MIVNDMQVLMIGLVLVGIALFVLMLGVAFAIIGINRNLKDLVELEYKKYNKEKEKNEQTTTISS